MSLYKATITLKNNYELFAYGSSPAEADRTVRFVAKVLGKENYDEQKKTTISPKSAPAPRNQSS